MDLTLFKVPVLTPLSAPPSRSIFTDAQWATLWAILDGAVPAFVPGSRLTDASAQIPIPDDEFDAIVKAGRSASDTDPEADKKIASFLALRPAYDDAFQDDILRTLGVSPGLGQLKGLLDLIGYISLS